MTQREALKDDVREKERPILLRGWPFPFEGGRFKLPRLRKLPLSFKLFFSLMFFVAGLSYLTLLLSIWNDTEMKIANITEAYGSMGLIELTIHSYRYSYWFFCIFLFSGLLFLFTGFPENLKRFFATAVPLAIIFDIGCAWLVRYHEFFAWQMAASGFFLAGSFLIMFLSVQYDLWLRR